MSSKIYVMEPRFLKRYKARLGHPPLCPTCNHPICNGQEVVSRYNRYSRYRLRHKTCAEKVGLIR